MNESTKTDIITIFPAAGFAFEKVKTQTIREKYNNPYSEDLAVEITMEAIEKESNNEFILDLNGNQYRFVIMDDNSLCINLDYHEIRITGNPSYRHPDISMIIK